LTTYISQGSVATDMRRGGSFNSFFSCRSFLNLTVKKLWKMVHVCRSYHKNKSGTCFLETRGRMAIHQGRWYCKIVTTGNHISSHAEYGGAST